MSSPGIGVNPLVSLGILNRLRASVTWPSNASLNVTASHLGKSGIRVAQNGRGSTPLEVMTGVVQSPEPYMQVTISIPLLKTQSLAALYKTQLETNALMGDCTIRPDATTMPNYSFTNCAIADVGELNFSGEDPMYGVSITGIYLLNSGLWAGS